MSVSTYPPITPQPVSLPDTGNVSTIIETLERSTELLALLVAHAANITGMDLEQGDN